MRKKRRRKEKKKKNVMPSTRETITVESPSAPVVTSTPTYTYPTTGTTTSSYVPMTWNASDNGTVTLTWTLTTVTPVLITTNQVVTANSTWLVSSTVTSSKSAKSPSPPRPTQSDITSACSEYYLTALGDSCSSIELNYNITFAEFYAWNPAIGSNCGNLWTGEAYCVGISSASSNSALHSSAAATSSTSSTSSTLTSVTVPGPSLSGITSACTKYYVTVSGDSCAAIEAKYDITFAEFCTWNPAIGSGCTSLWVDEAYCVSIS